MEERSPTFLKLTKLLQDISATYTQQQQNKHIEHHFDNHPNMKIDREVMSYEQIEVQDEEGGRVNIDFVQRQGKQGDEAQTHKILKSGVQIFKKGNEDIHRIKQNMLIGNNQQVTWQQQKVYKYLTTQIIQISNQNVNLKHKINKLQNQNQQLKNYKIIQQQQIISITSKYQQNLQNQNQSHQKSIQQTIIEIISLQNNLKQHEKQIGDLKELLEKRDKQKELLLGEIKKLRNQAMEVTQHKTRMGKKIGELMQRNQVLEAGLTGKSQAVDHLWQIKEIQYCNIVKLIQKQQPQFEPK